MEKDKIPPGIGFHNFAVAVSPNSSSARSNGNQHDRTTTASPNNIIQYSDVFSTESSHGKFAPKQGFPECMKSISPCAVLGNVNMRDIQYDFRKLIIRNIKDTISEEHIILYVEKITGEIEVESMHRSLELQHTILFMLTEELDPNFIKEAHMARPTLFGYPTEVILVEMPRKLMISGYGPDVSKDYLELYFTNRKRSMGSLVVDVEMFDEDSYALITFEDPECIIPVLSQSHMINGNPLTCSKYYDFIGSEPFLPHSFPPKPIIRNTNDDSRIKLLLKPSHISDRFRKFLSENDADLMVTDTELHIRCVNLEKISTREYRRQWQKILNSKLEEFLSELKVQSIKLTEPLPLQQMEEINKAGTKTLEGAVLLKLNEIEIAADHNTIDDLYKTIHSIVYPTITKAKAEVRGHHIDMLVNFLNLAQQAYKSLSIDVDKKNSRVTIIGDENDVTACKEYFRNIVKQCARQVHRLIPDIAAYLSNEDSITLVRMRLMKRGLVGSIYLSKRNQTKLTICSSSDDLADQIYTEIKMLITCKTIHCQNKNCKLFLSNTWSQYWTKINTDKKIFDRRHILTKVIDGWYIHLVGIKSSVKKLKSLIKSFMLEQNCQYSEIN
ncbi:hypothetical protein GJ496_008852 [Pomphorhynchus laevis]|nr:hypothetical protein GJ496_008852 [Pomphorhynchus laevis]